MKALTIEDLIDFDKVVIDALYVSIYPDASPLRRVSNLRLARRHAGALLMKSEVITKFALLQARRKSRKPL